MRIPGEVKFSYDRESDVLYSFVDHPRAAICEDLGGGILLRQEENTGAIVGFTIIGYQDLKKEGPIEVPYFEEVVLP